MDRTDQLLAEYFDGQLNAEELQELAQRLDQDLERRELFLDLKRQHGLLSVAHGRIHADAFATAVLAELHRDQEAFVGSVMRDVTIRAAEAQLDRAAQARRRTPWHKEWSAAIKTALPRLELRLRWVAAAACLTVLLALGVFHLTRPKLAQARLASVEGRVTVQRGSRVISPKPGYRLRPGDILQTGPAATATVNYRAEDTMLRLQERSELKCADHRNGKLYELRRGVLEAKVAPQPAGCPLVVASPQAQARVLGTRFSLAARQASTLLAVADGQVQFTRKTDRRSIQLRQGEFAVAASGVELAARPLEGEFDPNWPIPARVWLFSEYPEHDAWFVATDCIQQRRVEGLSFHPFKAPPLTGTVLLEAGISIETVAQTGARQTEGWGFGIGLRCMDEPATLSLRVLQDAVEGQVLQLTDLLGDTWAAVSCPLGSENNYFLKLRMDRTPGQPAVMRGKIWPRSVPEPPQWALVQERDSKGALAAVGVSTLNCACTFTSLKLSLID